MLPQIQGGSQERQRRAGTENVAGIVGFGAAYRIRGMAPSEGNRLRIVSGRLREGLLAFEGVAMTGHPEDRLPNNVSVVIDGVEGGDLVAALDLEGIETSTGSACTSGNTEPSHVLLAMGVDPHRAHGSLRLTLGRETSDADVDTTLAALHVVLPRLRSISGLQPKATVAV